MKEELEKEIREEIRQIEYRGGGVNGGDRTAKIITDKTWSKLEQSHKELEILLKNEIDQDCMNDYDIGYNAGVEKAIEVNQTYVNRNENTKENI